MGEDIKEKYIEKMGEPLGKLFYALWNEVAWLHFKWKQYFELYAAKSSRIELMNRAAPSFFRLVQDLCFEEIILHLARLTDPPKSCGRDNLTIKLLPEQIKDEIVAPEIQKLIENAVESTQFCRDRRNRHIAHRDLSLALKEGSEPLEQASLEKIGIALSAIVKVMNKVEFRMAGGTTLYSMGFAPYASAVQLLYLIDEGLKSKEERLLRLKNGEYNATDFKKREI